MFTIIFRYEANKQSLNMSGYMLTWNESQLFASFVRCEHGFDFWSATKLIGKYVVQWRLQWHEITKIFFE